MGCFSRTPGFYLIGYIYLILFLRSEKKSKFQDTYGFRFFNIELCTSNKTYVIGLCGFNEWVKCSVPATQWTINISCQYSKTFVFSDASGSEISLTLSYHISDLFVSFKDSHGAWARCIMIIFYCVRDKREEDSSSGLWKVIFCEPGVCSHYSSLVQSPAQSLLQLCEFMSEAWGDGQLGLNPGNYSLRRDRLYVLHLLLPTCYP